MVRKISVTTLDATKQGCIIRDPRPGNDPGGEVADKAAEGKQVDPASKLKHIALIVQ